MLIVNKNPSSHIGSMDSQQPGNESQSFSNNFKILNISALRNPDQVLALGP